MAASVAKTIPQSNDNIMSLTGYFSQSDKVVGKVMDIRSEANSYFQRKRDEFSKQIQVAKGIENQLFSYLKQYDINNIEQLNARIREYEKSKFPLSGSALKNAFLKGQSTITVIDPEIFKAKAISLLEKRKVETIDEKKLKECTLQELFSALRKSKIKGSRGVGEIAMIIPSTTESNQSFIDYRKLTKVQREIVTDMKLGKDAFKQIKMEAKIDNDEGQLFYWLDETQGLTPTEAKKLTADEVTKINKIITNEILSKCGNDPLIAKIIEQILDEQNGDTYVYFVGKNVHDVTGLLGEIKGMYYLAKLFGDGTSIPKGLAWQGGKHIGESGAKPHADLLFEGIGIQVKNTTKDIDEYFTSRFNEAKLETILNEIEEQYRQTIGEYFTLRTFNVPYYIVKKTGIAKNGFHKGGDKSKYNNFSQRAEHLKSLNQLVVEALAIFAASMMYINTNEIGLDKNSIYFVAGKSFILSSSILEDIYSQIHGIEGHNNFKITPSISQNIIQAYNEGERNVSIDQARANVSLASSYTFKIPK